METNSPSTPDQHQQAAGEPAAPQPSEFGLADKPLPKDPVEAEKQFHERDAADAKRDEGAFARGCRRALRLDELRATGVHARLYKSTWQAYLEQHVAGGYDSWSRYRAAARVQQQLHEWDLTLVSSEAVARAIAPRLKDPGMRDKLAAAFSANGGQYPSSRELCKMLAPKRRKKAPKTTDIEHLAAALESARLLVEERAVISRAIERLRAAHPTKSSRQKPDAQEIFEFTT